MFRFSTSTTIKAIKKSHHSRRREIMLVGILAVCVCMLLLVRSDANDKWQWQSPPQDLQIQQPLPGNNHERDNEGSSVCSLWLSTRQSNSHRNSSSVPHTINNDCIQQQIARVYSPKSPTQWCIPPSANPNVYLKHPARIADAAPHNIVGILFVKNTKAASSTGAGITLRIAEQVGQRLLLPHNNNNNSSVTQQPGLTATPKPKQASLAARSCVRNWTHAFANYRGHAPHRRIASNSLVWTIVRQPAKRDVSAFYFFEHARQGVDATDDNLQSYLAMQTSGQFRYLYSHKIADHSLQPAWHDWYTQHYHNLSLVLHSLLQSYDFIAVAERMDESLAVMTLLFDLDVRDIIVLSSKTKGGFDDGKFRKQCHKIPSPTTSHSIDRYLQSPAYLKDNLDTILYHAANTSLDWTVAALGRDVVQQRLEQVRYWQQLAQQQCHDKAVYPCSDTGILQRAAAQKSCYIDDSGCGHDCVDQVFQQYQR